MMVVVVLMHRIMHSVGVLILLLLLLLLLREMSLGWRSLSLHSA